MTYEGRVGDLWTTKPGDKAREDNVRPLLKALAAARRSLDEEHFSPTEPDAPDAVVVDIRPQPIVPAEGTPSETTARAEHPAARPHPEPGPAARTSFVHTPDPDTGSPNWIMVDPPEEATPVVIEPAEPAPEWGDLWRESVQGWVRDETGTKVWRPIVTTTTAVPNWEIDTNLGMVTGESACAIDGGGFAALLASAAGAASLHRELARDRRAAESSMVREAVARGAHAVIGVKLDYTPVGDCLIVTATGTAVTLRTRH
jgi:uncharacterized protein YbjQ (UPF0145 family)